jgi:hypothetical protein
MDSCCIVYYTGEKLRMAVCACYLWEMALNAGLCLQFDYVRMESMRLRTSYWHENVYNKWEFPSNS